MATEKQNQPQTPKQTPKQAPKKAQPLNSAELRELDRLREIRKPTDAQIRRTEALIERGKAAAAPAIAAENKRRAALSPAEKRKEELIARLESNTTYPMETVTAFRLELKAIANGSWERVVKEFGKWKPPRRKSDIDKFLDS